MERGQIKSGFKRLDKQIEGKEKYVADCKSCVDWSDENGCDNPNVCKYDICEDDGRVYCTYWSHIKRKEKWS